jgi:hypothetical protein
VVGKSGPKRLEKLIGEVSRGERDLSSIRDAQLREAVRVALRLHKDAPEAPDAYTRARMRARIMAGLRPRRPSLWDNAWTALELLSRPAPYIVRAIAVAAVLLCLGMGAVVASADSLPDDVLYPLKLASEQVRLALAEAPGDLAGVELSIAEHRLREAEALAGSGRTSDALVASAMYSQHIASAAEALASQDQNDQSDLGAQLESAFSAQRDRAQSLAATLATDVKSARGAEILALIASPTMAPGATKIERVAETAATLAVDVADAAETAAIVPSDETARAAETQTATATARATQTERAASVGGATQTTDAPRTSASGHGTTATPRATGTTRANSTRAVATPAPTRDPRAAEAAKITRKAADQARAAAEKLKQTLKDQHR